MLGLLSLRKVFLLSTLVLPLIAYTVYYLVTLDRAYRHHARFISLSQICEADLHGESLEQDDSTHPSSQVPSETGRPSDDPNEIAEEAISVIQPEVSGRLPICATPLLLILMVCLVAIGGDDRLFGARLRKTYPERCETSLSVSKIMVLNRMDIRPVCLLSYSTIFYSGQASRLKAQTCWVYVTTIVTGQLPMPQVPTGVPSEDGDEARAQV